MFRCFFFSIICENTIKVNEKNILYIANCSLLIVKAQQPTQEWIRRYSGLQPSYGANGLSVKLDSIGNVYVLVGIASDTTLGDYGLLKYNNSGNLIWSRYYNSPGNLSDGPVAFAVNPSGDAYITGNSGVNFTQHITTVKFNSSGILQWARVYNGGGPADAVKDIAIDNSGNVIIIGGTAVNNNLGYGLTIKYNPVGDSLWVKKFSQLSQTTGINKMVLDDSNNIYICGYNLSGMQSDYLIIKYNQNGNLQWYTTYNGISNNDDMADYTVVDSNRNVYVVGTNYAPPNLFYNTLLKLNSNGTIQWARPYAGILGTLPSCEYPKGFVITPDGNSIYYTTFCNNGGGGGYDIVTLKYNSLGDTNWVRRYSGGVANTSNYPSALKLDKFGNIYITGTANYPTSGDDYVTIKYLSNSTQQWIVRYDGGIPNNGEGALDVFIDTSLNVYVTGGSPGENGLGNAVTIKYSQPDGIQQISSNLPKEFRLEQNYPNPFNPSTNIRFWIAESGLAILKIYDILGREVEVIVKEELKTGTYFVSWDANNYPSGIYFYTMTAKSYKETKKMILIK